MPVHESNQITVLTFAYLSTDDIFKSTVHRAVNRTGIQRFSMPLFFGTDYNVKLEVNDFIISRRKC